jgi:predicted metal-binding protein
MNLTQKLDIIFELNNYIKDMTGIQTCLILAKDIFFDERVRIKCQINLCGNYGNNLMCPPFLPSLSENRDLVNRYNFALLLQLHQSVQSKNEDEIRKAFISSALHLNEILISLEKKAFVSGFPLALALGAGECKLCENCVAKEGNKQCRKPGSSRPSMEGMGIDVLQTYRTAGLPLDFIEGELTVAGLLLID